MRRLSFAARNRDRPFWPSQPTIFSRFARALAQGEQYVTHVVGSSFTINASNWGTVGNNITAGRLIYELGITSIGGGLGCILGRGKTATASVINTKNMPSITILL